MKSQIESMQHFHVDAVPTVIVALEEREKITYEDVSTKCSETSSICNESSSISSSSEVSTKPVRRTNKRKGKRRKRKAPSTRKVVDQEVKDRFIAIDCEMVGVGYKGQRSSLARVCLVDWDGNLVLDLYVKQWQDVRDYRTFVSGITEEQLTSDSAVTLDECRRIVQEKVKDKILVGHALKNDLSALKISHMWEQLRDTGKYEPFMKVRFDDGILWPRKLKDLAKEKLGKNIQRPGRPHCPIEDAKAAFSLYKKVQKKWEKKNGI